MTTVYDSSLPKHYKIINSSIYNNLLRSGKKIVLNNFSVIYNQNCLGHPRFGYIVGKKVAKKSVNRNRIKRLFREVFRQNKSSFDSYDLIFYATKDISEKSLHDISNDLFTAAEFDLNG